MVRETWNHKKCQQFLALRASAYIQLLENTVYSSSANTFAHISAHESLLERLVNNPMPCFFFHNIEEKKYIQVSQTKSTHFISLRNVSIYLDILTIRAFRFAEVFFSSLFVWKITISH